MKKIVSTFAFALLVGGLTFADDAAGIKFGAWGRGVFIPVVQGAADNMTALGVSWGGPVRTGFTVSGNSANVGFQVDINADAPQKITEAGLNDVTGLVSLGDQQKIWVKPIDGLTLQIGQAFDDTLRGNTAFGSWDWIRLGPINDEDNVFTRVNTHNGFEASFQADALYVYGAFLNLAAPVKTSDEFKGLQYGAGYTIKDIGLIRGQVIGGGASGNNQVEAALRLTAVQNLYADIGLKYMTKPDAVGGAQMLINAYANYAADKAKIHGLVTYGTNKTSDLNFMGVGAGLDYGLDGGLGLGSDVRYYSQKKAFGAADTDSLITFFGGVTKGFSNGLVGIGIEYSTKGGTVPAWGTLNYGSDVTKAQILVPVRLEYWF